MSLLDGLARPIGGSVMIKWQGKTYELRPITLRDFGTMENELLRRMRDTKMATVCAMHGKIPDEIFERQLARTTKECETLSVTPEQVQNWIDDREGLCYSMFLSLSRSYPGEFDLDDMLEVMMTQVPQEEINRLLALRDQANGFDEAGKETGPTQVEQADGPEVQTGE